MVAASRSANQISRHSRLRREHVSGRWNSSNTAVRRGGVLHSAGDVGKETPKKQRKTTLAEIAHRLGRKALADVAASAKPDTLYRWFRELLAKKFDGSRFRKSLG